ncbi:unnamed protein product, partial [Staurois parvus]
MLLTLVVSGKMPLTLVIIMQNAPYIGGQWENAPNLGDQFGECSLHWWSVGKMPLTLVISMKNAPYISGQWG